MLYPAARAALFQLDPETAHRLATGGLDVVSRVPGGLRILSALTRASRPTRCLGLEFRNPVGLAAGFDKNGAHIDALAALGFGFIEIGSVTALPALGNPAPRLFRWPAERALINRMGLNNEGAEAVTNRLAKARRSCPVFVNIAKTPDPTLEGAEAIADYVSTARALGAHADAIVLNVSCPNATHGQTFQDPALLGPLVNAVRSTLPVGKPLLVKVSPDLDNDALDTVIDVALEQGATGFTAVNTAPVQAPESGGLSGPPLHRRALAVVRQIRARTDAPIVGVGGVHDGASAQAMLDAGANLVQLYTGFIYGGPATVRDICRGLRG